MNERIKELAEQAWREIYAETAIDGADSSTPSIDEVVMFEGKFAELLIQECIEISKRADDVQPMTYAYIEIAKHLGVEE